MEFKCRLKEIIDAKGVTPYRIGVDTSVSKQSVMNYLSGKNIPTGNALKELAAYLEVSVDFLMGEDSEKVITVTHLEDKVQTIDNFRLVPLYSHDVVGGINNQEMDTNGYITGYIPFVNAKQDDICVPVTNDSMIPIYSPGTIVQIRKLDYWKEFVEFGKVHIIELNDDRRLIKTIRKGRDEKHFILESENPKHDDADISIEFIRSIWLVLSKYQKVVM